MQLSQRRLLLLAIALFLLVPLHAGGAQEAPPVLPPAGSTEAPAGPLVRNAYGASPQVVVPITFPVLGSRVSWSDSFGAPRSGGRRRHQGQDLMAPKMTPLVATFAGTVYFHRTDAPNVHNTLSLRGDDGWTAAYMHINNDTPGTDDGLGSLDYAFAPGLQPGDRVVAGQFLGWVGDSGNAESTGPHLHFELSGPEGVVNAAPSLRHAQHLNAARPALPAPDVRPGPGETRLDGALRLADPARELICLDLIATQPHSKKAVVSTAPARRWVRLQDVKLTLPDGTAPETAVDALPRGVRLTALVLYRGPSRAATATRLALHLPADWPAATGLGGAPSGRSAVPARVDATLPSVGPAKLLRELADRSLGDEDGGRVALSGGWDSDFLYLTLSAPEPFRARLEVDGLPLRVSEEGVVYGAGPRAGEPVSGGVVASRDAAGGMLLRVALSVGLLRRAEDGAATRLEGRIVQLRGVVELASGAQLTLPERAGALAVRLAPASGRAATSTGQ